MDDYRNIELFEGKNLSDLFKEIYDNSTAKRQQIRDLIGSLAPLVEGIGDATLLVPLIKEYLEIGVKNDEQLVKLAQLVQRIESNKKTNAGDDWGFLANLAENDQALSEELSENNKKVEDQLLSKNS